MKSVDALLALKGKERIVMLTAYDSTFATLIDQAGVDIILVGDSLGMVMLGYDGTREVTMADMLRSTAAVARGTERAHIVADLSYGSDLTPGDAVANARKLIKAGAHSVKTEGKPEIVKAIAAAGIEVMGHSGLLPQTAERFKVQGKDAVEAKRIMDEAIAIERAGAFSLVLECVPVSLAKEITERISIPTIGIGAGPHCDGQVLVMHDLLGLYDKISPRFVKRYARLSAEVREAVAGFAKEVRAGKFPQDEHSFQ